MTECLRPISLSDLSVNTISISLKPLLPGLESLEQAVIRPLPLMSLLSLYNRRLRLEFPAQRDYDLNLLAVNKGFINPQLSRQKIQGLPLKTIEQLAIWVGQASAEAEGYRPNPVMDALLEMIIALEETYQFDLSALVSEDLALMEAHPQSGVHGYLFKPTLKAESMQQILSSQGFTTAFIDVLPHDLPMAYWLCRRLNQPHPWSALLDVLPSSQESQFPFLARLKRIQEHLLHQDERFSSQQSVSDLCEALPQIRQWIETRFTEFSAEANIARPIQGLVLAEGATEELLIPVVAEAVGYNLAQEGIVVQAVGGKSQMLQQYTNFAECLAVPITMVLDKDAQSLLPDLQYYQRPQDQILILEEGEFEDMYSPNLIVKTVNKHYHTNTALTLTLLKQMRGATRVRTLQNVWQSLGLGIFNKVEFAQYLAQTLHQDSSLVSPPMQRVIEKIIERKQSP